MKPMLMTDEFWQVMRDYAKADDTVAVRASLRQYFDMLEELYRGILKGAW